jgi:hypothetical protein
MASEGHTCASDGCAKPAKMQVRCCICAHCVVVRLKSAAKLTLMRDRVFCCCLALTHSLPTSHASSTWIGHSAQWSPLPRSLCSQRAALCNVCPASHPHPSLHWSLLPRMCVYMYTRALASSLLTFNRARGDTSSSSSSSSSCVRCAVQCPTCLKLGITEGCFFCAQVCQRRGHPITMLSHHLRCARIDCIARVHSSGCLWLCCYACCVWCEHGTHDACVPLSEFSLMTLTACLLTSLTSLTKLSQAQPFRVPSRTPTLCTNLVRIDTSRPLTCWLHRRFRRIVSRRHGQRTSLCTRKQRQKQQ